MIQATIVRPEMPRADIPTAVRAPELDWDQGLRDLTPELNTHDTGELLLTPEDMAWLGEVGINAASLTGDLDEAETARLMAIDEASAMRAQQYIEFMTFMEIMNRLHFDADDDESDE